MAEKQTFMVILMTGRYVSEAVLGEWQVSGREKYL